MTITEQEKSKFVESVNKWGLHSQILMLAEESSELTVAALHYLREKKKADAEAQLAEEIADTQLMIDEIKFALCLEDMVQSYREAKLKRLEQYLR
jgi:hypothetical protein